MANFKVHARVLDLLGEEQIADCPTAISELFKNAYDAYATRVSLDVYVPDGRAILWDDGLGMSEHDVLTRWLVVGTPGKKTGTSISTPPDEMVTRPVMGEKGIGRLAISTLGDTLLLISKQCKDTLVPPYTALLINWNIVRNYQLLLSDIEIPVISFDHLADLETGIVDDMISSFLAPIIAEENANRWIGYEAVQQKIVDQLNDFQLDLNVVSRTGLGNKTSGTAFYISNLASDLPLYVASPNKDESDKDTPQALLVQLLNAFQKELVGDEFGIARKEVLEIEFSADVRVEDKSSGQLRSVFEDWQTFNEDDLSIADHHFKINFDEYGRYSGTIKRYDEFIVLPPAEQHPKLGINCGAFSMEFWYWQGDGDETKLTYEQKALIDKKLAIFGGLLLYRDNLRVLPYGRPEFDWLKMEERRSLKASRNFFSYRRMFGSVSIDGKENIGLRDKAGREGLKTNKEYRDFRKALVSFLISIARDYFGESAEFKMKKAEVEAHQVALKKELNKVEARRKKLTDELSQRLKIMADGDAELKELLNNSLSDLREFAGKGFDDEVIKTNINFENRVLKIEESARLIIPTNLSIGKSGKLRKLKHDYEEAWPKFKEMCVSIRETFALAVKKEMPDVAGAAFRKRAIENALLQGRAKIGKANADVRNGFEHELEIIESALEEFKRSQLITLEATLFSHTFSRTVEQAVLSKYGEVPAIIGALGQAASDAEAEAKEFGLMLIGHLQDFSERRDEDIKAIQTDEIEELKQQLGQNLELIQLGLSVEIIDHDLQKLYRGIKTTISKLQRLLKEAPKSMVLLHDLSANFQHLEQRYQLMSPLYRNSYRLKADFDGRRIFEYLERFLEHELEVHGVKFLADESFMTLQLYEVPARVLPVFINIVDNAIFWLKDSEKKEILLSRIDDVVTINDTGSGIHPTMIAEIFKPFVSEKSSGRGLGLYIARANLEVAGHEIWAELKPPYRTMQGACLCIRFNQNALVKN